MSPIRKEKKTVVITGGATGIGFEAAKLLLETDQYRVALIGRNKNHLETAANELGGTSDSISIYTCDLRKPDQIHQTVERIVGNFNGIYGLVNNAGVYPFGGLLTTTRESWNEIMEVNLTAPFLLSQAVAPVMARGARNAKGRGGRIINLSSTAGILPNHFALAYSVSKAGLVHLTKTLAKELGKDGITVNCICPGIVRTPLHDAYHASKSELEEFYNRRGAAYPMGRVGEPHDVAAAIRFLLSEEASWITGDVMIVDGGRLLT